MNPPGSGANSLSEPRSHNDVSPSPPTRAPVSATLVQTTMAPWFDCNEGYWDWEHLWSEDQKTWCCASVQRGCAYTSGFDCDEDLKHWEDAWSNRKKKYCCKLGKPGCSMFNCTVDYSSMSGGWSS